MLRHFNCDTIRPPASLSDNSLIHAGSMWTFALEEVFGSGWLESKYRYMQRLPNRYKLPTVIQIFPNFCFQSPSQKVHHLRKICPTSLIMVLGSCTILIPGSSRKERLSPIAVSMNAELRGMIAKVKIRQEFKHTASVACDVTYIVPNNSKICMYDTTFTVGNEVIKPKLEEKKQAEQIFVEAKQEGSTALLASNIGDGLVEFKLGNISNEVPVIVEVTCCVCCNFNDDIMFFKFNV